jgi:hypothetical protein
LLDLGYAKITVQSGSGVFAFASVTDNITNDPTLVTMQRQVGRWALRSRLAFALQLLTQAVLDRALTMLTPDAATRCDLRLPT